MPIDASIYRNIQTPDYAGSFAQGMNMRDMIQQRKLRDKYEPEDRGFIMEERAHFRQKKKMENAISKMDVATRVLGSVKDQSSYDVARKQLGQMGDFSHLPSTYDPNIVGAELRKGLSVKDNASLALKERDYQQRERALGQKDRDLNIQARAAAQKARNYQTPFETELTKKSAQTFAKRQEGVKKLNASLTAVDEALGAQQKYSQESKLGGTGWAAQAFGAKKYFDKETEQLEAKLRVVDLKNMVNTFAGMSKAIDTEHERAAWQGTQANIINDDETNMNIMLAQKSILMKDKAETMAQQAWIESNGNMRGYQSPIDGQVTSMVNLQGEMKLVPKEYINEAKGQGFMEPDDYAEKSITYKANALKRKRKQIEKAQKDSGGLTLKTNEIEWK